MRYFCLFLVCITFLSASANVEDLKSQLKLAEISKNYDQQYLILDKLQKLKPALYKRRFEKLTKFISHTSKLKTAIANHDHEQVLIHADKILTVDPSHPVALEHMTKSGKILRHLIIIDNFLPYLNVYKDVVFKPSKPVKVPVALNPEQHQINLIKTCQKLLADMGYRSGIIKGKKNRLFIKALTHAFNDFQTPVPSVIDEGVVQFLAYMRDRTKRFNNTGNVLTFVPLAMKLEILRIHVDAILEIDPDTDQIQKLSKYLRNIQDLLIYATSELVITNGEIHLKRIASNAVRFLKEYKKATPKNRKIIAKRFAAINEAQQKLFTMYSEIFLYYQKGKALDFVNLTQSYLTNFIRFSDELSKSNMNSVSMNQILESFSKHKDIVAEIKLNIPSPITKSEDWSALLPEKFEPSFPRLEIIDEIIDRHGSKMPVDVDYGPHIKI